MNKLLAVGVGLLVLLVLILFSATYTVRYNEVAIRATFGQASETGVVREPGLHFRLPVFIDRVAHLDTRVQLVESPLEEITTADGLQVVVRAFLLWKVDEETDAGPLRFFRSYESIDNARSTLSQPFRTAFTGVLSQYAFDELIGRDSMLTAAEGEILTAVADRVGSNGVKPIAVGLTEITLPAATTRAVVERMNATRQKLAEVKRSAGSSEADRIRSEATTWADKIRAFANQRADELQAKGEQDKAQYIAQLNEAPDLAMFLIWLDTLRTTLSQKSTIVLDSSIAPLHLIDRDTPISSAGIPVPPSNPSVADGSNAAASNPVPAQPDSEVVEQP